MSERTGRSITHGTVSNYENGKSLPRADYVIALCEECNINPMWLILGEGPRELSKARETGGAADAKYLDRQIRATLDRVLGELGDGGRQSGDGRQNGSGNGSE